MPQVRKFERPLEPESKFLYSYKVAELKFRQLDKWSLFLQNNPVRSSDFVRNLSITFIKDFHKAFHEAFEGILKALKGLTTML